jgi:hypothetical protein
VVRFLSPRTYYRRRPGGDIVVRTAHGKWHLFGRHPASHRMMAKRSRDSMPSTHSMVSYQYPAPYRHLRYGAGLRTTDQLRAAFGVGVSAGRVVGPAVWHPLPQRRITGGRIAHQGMAGDVAPLLPVGTIPSATNYAAFLRTVVPPVSISTAPRWHWCHLIGHGLGGDDGPGNVLAGTMQNNGEQMAIENALVLYANEHALNIEIMVQGTRLNAGDGRFMGDVIKYEINCHAAGTPLTLYLDCQPSRHSLSAEHFGKIHSTVTGWLNECLERTYRNTVSRTEIREIEALRHRA